jgi:N-acetylglucosamine repressor
MKQNNLLVVLRAVREHGPTVRQSIRAITSMSWGTIASSVQELCDKKLIKEQEKVNTGVGRRPTEIDLDVDHYRVLGLRIGSASIKAVLLDIKGKRLHECSIPTDSPEEGKSVIDLMYEAIDRTIEQGCARTSVLAGIGVAVPGALDLEAGVCLFAPRHPELTDMPLRKLLEERYGIPCFLDHVNNCAALGERWFGRGKDSSSFLCMLLGTGISAGIFINDDIFRGANSTAGEVGHISIDKAGKKCLCGKKGCLETYASGPAIAARAREEAATKGGARLLELAGGDLNNITAETVSLAARAGDKTAIKIYGEIGRYLGRAISDLINLFNTECIILCGRVSLASEFFLESLESTVRENAWPYSQKKILVSELDDSATMGGAAMVLREIYEKGLLL